MHKKDRKRKLLALGIITIIQHVSITNEHYKRVFQSSKKVTDFLFFLFTWSCSLFWADWISTYSGDTCLISEEHYYSAITWTGKHHCSMHWRLPSSAEGKMNSTRFIYHTSCLLCSTKDEKRGETNGKANQLHEKESCHLSNIHSVLCRYFVFSLPTAHIFEIEFWKPYTLLTPFMLHQFTEVGSFFFSPHFALFLFWWDKI